MGRAVGVGFLALVMMVSVVEARPSLQAQYQKRASKAQAKKTSRMFVGLAKWCRKKRMFEQERGALERALELNAQDKTAKKLLARLDARAKTHRDMSTPWRREGRELFVETNTSEAKLHYFCDTVNAFYKRFSKVFNIRKGPTKLWGTKIGVKIFRTREDFNRYRQSQDGASGESTVGYYHLGRKELVLYDDPDDPRETLDTLFHEGTHLFTHMAFGEQTHNLPAWLCEGLAEFFGPSRYDAEKRDLVYGVPQYGRLRRAKELIGAGSARLKTLVGQQRLTSDGYALAWSAVYMLIQEQTPGGKRPRYRSAFLRMLNEVRKSGRSVEAFTNHLGTPESLEERWTGYVSKLELTPFHEGLALIRKGETAKAQELLSKHCATGDADARGHYYLGDTYFEQKKYVHASKEYEKAVALNPDYSNAHGSLAFTLALLGKGKEALVHGRKAVEIRPSPLTYYYYAYACLEAKAKAEGLKAVARAILLRGQVSSSLRSLRDDLNKLP